eukprot:4874683-Amphidinium_carterae.1
MKAGNHTFAITTQPGGLALFKRSDGGQKLSTTNGLLEPRKGQPDTFTSVSVVANPTTTEVRVAATMARTIRPHNVDTRPGHQSRFM